MFDKEYYTWDKLRSIPEFGTTGMVHYSGEGIERYTQPGRNYSFMVEYRF